MAYLAGGMTFLYGSTMTLSCGYDNRNQKVEEKFLKKYYQKMPRVMLRYAIEKFSEEKRRFYLGKKK